MSQISSQDTEDRVSRSPVLKFLLILIAILVVLGLGLFTIITRHGTGLPLQTVTMSDGTTVDLLAVKTGKELEYDARPLLERWVQKLPDSMRYYFSDKRTYAMHTRSSTHERLFVVARYSTPPYRSLRWTISNEHGWRREGDLREQRIAGATHDLIAFDSFPRNDRFFELVASSNTTVSRELASVRISNPLYRPQVTASSTAVSKVTSGTYTLELVKLIAAAAPIPERKWNSGAPLEPFEPPSKSEATCQIAVFQVLENGVPTNSLIPSLMMATSPSGVYEHHYRHLYAYQNGVHYYMPESILELDGFGSFYAGDGLWKVDVEFVPSVAAPDYHWEVVSRISTSDFRNRDVITTSIKGMNVTLKWGEANSNLDIRSELGKSAPRVLSVMDDSGRDILTTHPAVDQGHNIERFHLRHLRPYLTTSSLGLPPSTTATIRMAIVPGHSVTFAADPVYASQQK